MRHNPLTRTMLALLLLCLACTLVLPPASAGAAGKQPPRVLLLYDSLAKGAAGEGNVAVLERLLSSYGAKVTLAAMERYKPGTLRAYTKVIAVANAPDLAATHRAYAADLAGYAGDYLHVGADLPAAAQAALQCTVQTVSRVSLTLDIGGSKQSDIAVQELSYIQKASGKTSGVISWNNGQAHAPYSVQDGRYTYVPYLEKGNLSEVAMAQVLKDWLHVSAAGRTYLLIKEVYPFSDLQLLEEMSDQLYDAGIPFMLSIRPVFSNTGYPAMKRYLEALKYAQSRNGTIVVNAPVVRWSVNSREEDTLRNKMQPFIAVLADNGIAPLAIGTELYWSHDKVYAEKGMGFFDSVVLFPDENPVYMAYSDTAAAFASSLFSMRLDWLEKLDAANGAMLPFPMDTAVTLDFFDNRAQLDAAMQSIRKLWVEFADYKNGDHQVQAGTVAIASHNGVISLNGKAMNMDYAPKRISANYEYAQKSKKSLTKAFNAENQFFIVAILVSLMIFGGLFVVGRRLYRQKFMK